MTSFTEAPARSGCPTWPRCTDESFVATPELAAHGADAAGGGVRVGDGEIGRARVAQLADQLLDAADVLDRLRRRLLAPQPFDQALGRARDARDLGTTLERLGFKVILRQNANIDVMVDQHVAVYTELWGRACAE